MWDVRREEKGVDWLIDVEFEVGSCLILLTVM